MNVTPIRLLAVNSQKSVRPTVPGPRADGAKPVAVSPSWAAAYEMMRPALEEQRREEARQELVKFLNGLRSLSAETQSEWAAAAGIGPEVHAYDAGCCDCINPDPYA